MATYTANSGERAVHNKTLTGNTEDTVTLGDDFDQVEVMVSALTAPVYFTVDSTAASVAGGGTYVIASAGSYLQVPVPTAGNTIVRLISAAAATYFVTGVKP